MSGAGLASMAGDRVKDLIEQLARAGEAMGEPDPDQAGWRLLLEHAPLVLWATDARLRLTSLEGAGLEAVKLRPDEVLGLSLEEVVAQEPQASAILEAHRRARAGERVSYQVEARGCRYRAALQPLRHPPRAAAGIVTNSNLT
jgi:PAS domain-containing protein